MDITVANFLPFELQEKKPGLMPELYVLPKEENGIPGVLHINNATSNLYIRDGKTFPVTHPAEEVADALVNDFSKACLEASDDAGPALLWVPGRLTGAEILSKFKKEVDAVKAKQNRWFIRLIRLADDDWKRTGQHRFISDIQRHAARAMGQIHKPWLSEANPVEMVKCPACNTMIEKDAAVCYNCKHVVNEEKAKAIGVIK